MPRPLTVYGTLGGRPQRRRIVATNSKKAARELLGMSAYDFERFAGATGNAVEVAVATARPGVVFSALDGGTGNRDAADYRPEV